MKIATPIAGLIFLAATLASGWWHGQFVNRWRSPGALDAAAGKLGKELPPRLGPWRMAKTLKLDRDVQRTLQCAGHLLGIYTNDQTGETMTVAVLAGPSGPLTAHTPEVCFPGSDYELAADKKRFAVIDEHQRQHTLWQIHANARDATRPNLRVLYGWSRGGSWEAVRGPRFALAGLPLLYKVQIAASPLDPGTQQATDPAQDFLARFLAQLQPRLISNAQDRSSAN